MNSILKLFKVVLIDEDTDSKNSCYSYLDVLQKSIQHGFCFSPEVFNHYTEQELYKLIESIGFSSIQLNATFHKSWEKVKNASMDQLVREQILHYFTTYTYEQLGLYDSDFVYIPDEELDLPEQSLLSWNLFIVKGCTKTEIREKLVSLLQSGIALHEDTIEDIVDAAKIVNISEKDLSTCKNKEVRIRLNLLLDIPPKNPIEFLRTIVYKTTNNTLLIKSKRTIKTIMITFFTHSLLIEEIEYLFTEYENKYGLEKLAEIFYRFKPLFLAFKVSPKLCNKINRIRKLAKKYHKPMPEDYLNNITSILKNGKLDIVKFQNALAEVNIFRKIRLAYALNYRMQSPESIVYKIRNGRSFATDYVSSNTSQFKNIFDIIISSIVSELNVAGKKIYIPEYVEYGLPASEKQFTGNIPFGSCISVPSDMLIGIHWNNIEKTRVDLDLSLTNALTKYGWDGEYREDEGAILFSGDITDAPGKKGATEVFYVGKNVKTEWLVNVNYYNRDFISKPPFTLFIAKTKVEELTKNYLVNPNDIIATSSLTIGPDQKILGYLDIDENEIKFYFGSFDSRLTQTSSYNDHTANHGFNYLQTYCKNPIKLSKILEQAGAIITSNPQEEYDINLTPSQLGKNTILELLTGDK